MNVNSCMIILCRSRRKQYHFEIKTQTLSLSLCETIFSGFFPFQIVQENPDGLFGGSVFPDVFYDPQCSEGLHFCIRACNIILLPIFTQTFEITVYNSKH